MSDSLFIGGVISGDCVDVGTDGTPRNMRLLALAIDRVVGRDATPPVSTEDVVLDAPILREVAIDAPLQRQGDPVIIPTPVLGNVLLLDDGSVLVTEDGFALELEAA